MDVNRLAKICGLLGSCHPGERAAAALKATAMLEEAGMTWEAFVRSVQHEATQDLRGKAYAPERKPKRAWRKQQKKTFDTEQPHAALARHLLDRFFPSFINKHAAQFLRDVAGSLACMELTEGQSAYLDDIARKCASMEKRRKKNAPQQGGAFEFAT